MEKENNLEGVEISLWVDTTKQTNYLMLDNDDKTYDVVIVGGGITGVVTAYDLQKAGLSVALVEKERIVEWTTGSTTAKLSAQHYLIYDYLIKRHGKEVAKAYAKANMAGIDEIESLSQKLNIDCDYSRRAAYVFTNDEKQVEKIKQEVEAAKSLDLPASFETEIDLPFDIKGAIKFANQAQFHPRKFLLSLAEKFVESGGIIYEHTEVTNIIPGEINEILTKTSNLKARNVVQASGAPFWHPEIFDGKFWTKISYGLGVKLKAGETYPKNMYITTDEPLRSIRTSPYKDGEIMIFGGESHEYDEATFNSSLRYQTLIEDVRKRFPVEKVHYRWFAGDVMPYDRIPYIGPMPKYKNVYVMTGYRAWGLAWAMSASKIIVADILGKPLSWAKYFSLDRLKEEVKDEDRKDRI